MRLAAAIAAALVAASAAPGAAAMFDEGYAPCGERPNTVAVVDCITAKHRAADRRSNPVC